MNTARKSQGGVTPIAKTPRAKTSKSRSGKRAPKTSGAARKNKPRRKKEAHGIMIMPSQHRGPDEMENGTAVLIWWPVSTTIFIKGWHDGQVGTTDDGMKYIVYGDVGEDGTVIQHIVEDDTIWKHHDLDYESDEDVKMDCYKSKKDEYTSPPEDETDVHPRKPNKRLLPMAVSKKEPEAGVAAPMVIKDERPPGRLAKAKAEAPRAMSSEEAKQKPLGAAAGLFDDHGDTRVEEDTPRKQASFSGPLTPQPASEHGDNKSDTFGDESEVEVEVDTEVETDGEVEGEDIAVEERRMIVEQEVAPVVQEKEEKKPFNWDERDLNIPSDEEAEEEDFDAALAAMEQQPYPPHWCTGIVH
jgi:hypothetical protein